MYWHICMHVSTPLQWIKSCPHYWDVNFGCRSPGFWLGLYWFNCWIHIFFGTIIFPRFLSMEVDLWRLNSEIWCPLLLHWGTCAWKLQIILETSPTPSLRMSNGLSENVCFILCHRPKFLSMGSGMLHASDIFRVPFSRIWHFLLPSIILIIWHIIAIYW